MTAVEKIRNALIDKILNISNKDVLLALDTLISSNSADVGIDLTSEQVEMLNMSEDDIKHGRVISQEAMNKRNLEWLNEL